MPEQDAARAPQKPKRAPETPLDRIMTRGGARAANESFYVRVIRPWGDRILEPGTTLARNFDLDAIRFRLMRAGFPRGLRAQDFVMVKLALTLGMALVFPVVFLPALAIVFSMELPAWSFIAGALVGALYGFKAPDLWLSTLVRKRQAEIVAVMPDMIDLITVSVEAGLGLDAAIQRISQRFPNALSDEFQRAIQEVRLGRTRAESLRDMSRRVDVSDLTLLITSLIQADLLGISIANVLRVQSERLREKRSQRAREQAQKAPIKMMFPLVLFILPALFVVILGPAVIIAMKSGFAS
jgi:tight adherence protein C